MGRERLPRPRVIRQRLDHDGLQGERPFERAFAKAHGADDAVAVSSCTAGLHLILHALGIGPATRCSCPR